jgi:uncharacterized protein YciI
MHYLLFYEKVPDYAAREGTSRAAHRDHVLAAVRQGELILAGSLADPLDGAAILLFRSDGPATAEAFARADPYVQSGVVNRWRVRAWETVVGEGAARPSPQTVSGSAGRARSASIG